MSAMLYHYTCSCSLEKIRADGWTLKPNRLAPLVGLPSLVWLTDMETPDRWALGLTSETLSCDRTEHRLIVPDAANVLPWSKWCRVNRVTRAYRDRLEIHTAQPRHWFVSSDPVQAIEEVFIDSTFA